MEHVEFLDKINLGNSASVGFIKKIPASTYTLLVLVILITEVMLIMMIVMKI